MSTCVMLNEKEIISQVLNGDLKVYELLIKEYEKLVYLVISRLVTNKEDAEDICQEVFMKVYKNLSSFSFQSKLSTWIARIAYNTSINYLKKYKGIEMSEQPADINSFHFTNDNPETQLAKKDHAAYIHQLINQMPVQFKTVITLYHLYEFSYQEIEDITGMPDGTVKSYLFRARKLLKEKLEVYLKD
ncbi:MAG: sigma-70 family RNA polymerase sigma factor [Chitinophagaceae bacterium]